jgi:DNA-binding transcriptional ArsR family regulator
MTTETKQRDVFEAIADPTRRELLQLLADTTEAPLYQLTLHFDMGRTAVSKHLTILWEANLVKKRKVGRETRYQLNPLPLQEVKDWVSYYENFWNERMHTLHQLLEEKNL